MATISTNNYNIGGIDLYFNASPAHSSLLATDPSVASGLGGRLGHRQTVLETSFLLKSAPMLLMWSIL